MWIILPSGKSHIFKDYQRENPQFPTSTDGDEIGCPVMLLTTMDQTNCERGFCSTDRGGVEFSYFRQTMILCIVQKVGKWEIHGQSYLWQFIWRCNKGHKEWGSSYKACIFLQFTNMCLTTMSQQGAITWLDMTVDVKHTAKWKYDFSFGDSLGILDSPKFGNLGICKYFDPTNKVPVAKTLWHHC